MSTPTMRVTRRGWTARYAPGNGYIEIRYAGVDVDAIGAWDYGTDSPVEPNPTKRWLIGQLEEWLSDNRDVLQDHIMAARIG